MSVGVILPGWFYVWLYCGIFAPLQMHCSSVHSIAKGCGEN
jgi:hypothetical protein